MKVIFNSVKIENFLSIGKAEIILKDRGYCLINGVNKNPKDAALSNGSGKSSIIDSIFYCLTGETIRGAKNVVNMFNPGGTLVELDFQADQNHFVIMRSKDHSKYKTDLKIFVNGEDKSGKTLTDSKKILATYLPDLTPSLIGSVITLGQGLPQRFTNNTPSGRKEILEKLSKSDFMIEDLKNRLAKRKNALNNELRECEDNLLSLDSTKQTLNTQISQSKIKLESMGDASAYDEIINRAKEKIAYIDNQIKDLTFELNNHRVKLDELKRDSFNIENELKDKYNENIKSLLEEKSSLNSKIATLNSQIRQITKEISDIENIKDVCPTCGQKLPNVFKPSTEDKKLELSELQIQCQGLNESLKLLGEKEKQFSIEYNNHLLESTKELKQQINEVNANVQSKEKSLAIINNDRNSEQNILTKYESLKASYQATIDTLQDTIINNTAQISKLDEKSVYYRGEKDKISNKLNIINKFITVTNRDFRGYLLKNVISFIDKKAKEYCLEVFSTEDIQFVLDGNNIEISYLGKEYELLSGGEKQKIDMIIQLSLRDMLCQFLNFRSNIIAFDEIFDNMDANGCDKVIDLISKKLTDVSSVFIITHHQDLNIPSDNVITVTKQEDGVSVVA